MILHSVSLFVGAFLLFQVQPIVGKVLLPAFGGAPAVWLTCLTFFQCALLAGYAYAHFLGSRFSPRAQAWTHSLLLAASLAFLPIPSSWADAGLEPVDPTLSIVRLLATSIGVPFVLLAATSPLVQNWFARVHPDRSPYRLYATSNLGSLLALVTYPLLVEPRLTLRAQTGTWSLAVVGLVGLLWACAATVCGAAPSERRPDSASRPSALDLAIWLALAAAGSILLLGTTNQLCQNVAPVPFLWVLPLLLYLLSFVLCFESDRFTSRNAWGWAFFSAILGTVAAFALGPKVGLVGQVSALAAALFTGCMVCHGELARARPAPEHLTRFYLTIAAGGAIGGLVVTVVSPLVFPTYWELPAGLALACTLRLVAPRVSGFAARRRSAPASKAEPRRLAWRPIALGALVPALVALLGPTVWADLLRRNSVLRLSRNFYGVLRVADERLDDPSLRQRRLTHGSTVHGIQFLEPDRRGLATAYYGPGSGVGIVMRGFAATAGDRADLRVGVVGLGAGTLAAYAGAGTTLRFYEINPAVVAIAEADFSFLRDARARGARVEVVTGDARLRLDDEASRGRASPYDLLVLDAFSSDAVPAHLLTIEALDVYLRRLRPDGVLAFHLSNLYLDLSPVVRGLARARGLASVKIDSPGDESLGTTPSEWMLLAQRAETLDTSEFREARLAPARAGERTLLWTDDYSSLWPLLR